MRPVRRSHPRTPILFPSKSMHLAIIDLFQLIHWLVINEKKKKKIGKDDNNPAKRLHEIFHLNKLLAILKASCI